MRPIPHIALTAAILLVSAVPASAATYNTLTVPVTISGVPAGWHVQIDCTAGDGMTSDNVGDAQVALSGGAAHGNVIVTMNKPMPSGRVVNCKLSWWGPNNQPTPSNPPGYTIGPGLVTSVTVTIP